MRAWTLATDQGPWTDKTLATTLFGTGLARRGTEGDLAESLGDAFIDTFGALELELAESVDDLPPARRAQGATRQILRARTATRGTSTGWLPPRPRTTPQGATAEPTTITALLLLRRRRRRRRRRSHRGGRPLLREPAATPSAIAKEDAPLLPLPIPPPLLPFTSPSSYNEGRNNNNNKHKQQPPAQAIHGTCQCIHGSLCHCIQGSLNSGTGDESGPPPRDSGLGLEAMPVGDLSKVR
jgi:hypothetical protein